MYCLGFKNSRKLREAVLVVGAGFGLADGTCWHFVSPLPAVQRT